VCPCEKSRGYRFTKSLQISLRCGTLYGTLRRTLDGALLCIHELGEAFDSKLIVILGAPPFRWNRHCTTSPIVDDRDNIY
jgi:hypothetical protein